MTLLRLSRLQTLPAAIWVRVKGFLHWHYRLLLRLLLALVLVFVGAALVWQCYLLPRLDEFRPWLQDKFAQATGNQIRLGRIEGGWRAFRPGFHIQGLTILDRDGNPALQLDALDADVAWWSLFAGQVRFRHLAISAPTVDVLRDGQGIWHVAGFALATGGGKGNNQLANWFLNQDEVDVRGGTLRYADQLSQSTPVEARNMLLHLRRIFSRHSFEFAATPPAEIGQPFTVGGVWYGSDVANWRNWSGHGRIVAQQVALDSLWQQFPADALPVAVASGTAGGKLDFSFGHGVLTQADLQLDAHSLLARYAGRTLELPRFAGHLRWNGEGAAQSLSFDGEQIATRDGIVCNDCRFGWNRDKAGKRTLSLTNWQLDHLAGLRDALPATLLQQIPPGQLAGQVHTLQYTWQGDWDKPAHFNGKANIDNLAVQWPGTLPQWGPANIQADFSDSSGSLHVDSNHFVLDYPQQFVEPIKLDQLALIASWQRKAPGWHVNLDVARLTNKDMNVSVAGQYNWPGTGAGKLDLDGVIKGLEASRAYAYLPRVVGDDTLAWLKDSLLHGRAYDGKIQVHGNLQDFPFQDDKTGLFRITATAQDVTLRFANDWPEIAHITGALDFHGNAMFIHAPQAQTRNARLSNVDATIADLGHARVQIAGKAQDHTNGFLDYLKATPLHGMLASYIDPLKTEGDGDLTLKLDIPIENVDNTKVAGVYHFANNKLDFDHNAPVITAASGQIAFTDTGMSFKDVNGQLLGGPVQISGNTDKDGALRLQFGGKGQLGDAISRFDATLATRLHGQIAWQGQLLAGHDKVDLTLASSMVGAVVDMPAPVGKAAAQARPLHLHVAADKNGYDADLAWERTLQATLHQPANGAPSGNLALGVGPAVASKSGFVINGGWPEVNFEDWYRFIDQQWHAPDTGANAGVPGIAQVDLSFDRASGWGRVLNDLKLKASQGGTQNWQGDLASREMSGHFGWNGQGKGKLIAHLGKVYLPLTNSGAQPVESSPLRSLPAVELTVDDFRYKGLQLGKLDVEGVQQGDAWSLNKVTLDNPDGHFDMSGLWRQANGKSHVSGQFGLASDDFGKLLARIGYPDTLRRAPGKVTGKVEWDGEPFPPDFPSMQGNINVDVNAGQFARIDPGAGRLLSILSLQSLTRRVQLDFRDVFSQGFEFDAIHGDSVIEKGVARTDNLVITGSSAQVLFRGAANFEAGTQDLRVRIVPVIGDSVAVATTIVNPIAGVAAFLLQRALKDPLGQLIAYEYDITGSMSDPKIRRVQEAALLENNMLHRARATP
ncbi:uncharacterized protein (TIGR02099 family) [Silvimonas terrae]|uniref:Uncharacterized protein (TIGR02099 family) n=1 Tax=Silvimonas terrae TaxID=300266 RepID=A0A840RH74_9NEIS|nr:YhdP family protein [Silvimonas terrae]MBB5192675.1 uncharacterized protein (TIGR02099 family) [Silvimonas terrae]